MLYSVVEQLAHEEYDLHKNHNMCHSVNLLPYDACLRLNHAMICLKYCEQSAGLS